MSFDNLSQRFAMVELDYDPDLVSSFSDDGAALMTTGWGEDLFPANDVTNPTTGRFPRLGRRRHFL